MTVSTQALAVSADAYRSGSVPSIHGCGAVSGHAALGDQEEYVLAILVSPSSEVDRTPVVYLFLVCYGRQKADQLHLVIPHFLQVRVPSGIASPWNC